MSVNNWFMFSAVLADVSMKLIPYFYATIKNFLPSACPYWKVTALFEPISTLFPTNIHATFWLTLLKNYKTKLLIHLIVPMWDIIKAFMICDIINDNDSMCASIITISDGSETLLSCRIPLFLSIENYQDKFAFLSIYVNVFYFLLLN